MTPITSPHLLTSVGLVSLLLFLNYKTFVQADKRLNPWVIFIFFSTILFLRILHLRDIEIEVDTSTWIAASISIDRSPDPLWKLFLFSDSRPLTVLPLYLLLQTGLPLNHITSELVAVLLSLGTIYVAYRAFCYWLPPTRAWLVVSCYALFTGSISSSTYAPYNSEVISIFLLTVCLYGYLNLHHQAYRSTVLLLATGLLLGSLLYAKFQNVPMGLVIAGFIAAGLIRLKKWQSLSLFILAGILPTLLVNLLYFSKGDLSGFWFNYLLNYFEYSYTTQFQSLPLAQRFSPARVARFILDYPDSRFFFATGFAGAFIGGVWLLTVRRFPVRLLLPVLLLATSLYAVLQSGNSFGHYLLYLFFPLLLFVGALITGLPPAKGKILLILILAAAGFQALYNVATPFRRPAPEDFPYDQQVVAQIRQHSGSTDNIVIWGWIDRFHYLSQRACGYRLAHTHQLFLNSQLLPYRIDLFLSDLKESRPALFLEDRTGQNSTLPQLFKPLDSYPQISQYLQENYTLLTIINDIAIYKRTGTTAPY